MVHKWHLCSFSALSTLPGTGRRQPPRCNGGRPFGLGGRQQGRRERVQEQCRMLGSPAPLPVRVSAACPALCRAPRTSGHRLRALGAHGLVGSSEPITRTTAYLSPWRVTSATKSGRTVPPWLVRRGSGWPEAHRRLPHGRKNHARTGVKPGEGGTGAREAAAPEEVKELQEGCSRAGGPAGTGPAHLEARQGAQVARGDGEELPRRQGQIRVRNVGCGWHPPRPVGPAAGRRVPSGSQAPSRAGTAPAGAGRSHLWPRFFSRETPGAVGAAAAPSLV